MSSSVDSIALENGNKFVVSQNSMGTNGMAEKSILMSFHNTRDFISYMQKYLIIYFIEVCIE